MPWLRPPLTPAPLSLWLWMETWPPRGLPTPRLRVEQLLSTGSGPTRGRGEDSRGVCPGSRTPAGTVGPHWAQVRPPGCSWTPVLCPQFPRYKTGDDSGDLQAVEEGTSGHRRSPWPAPDPPLLVLPLQPWWGRSVSPDAADPPTPPRVAHPPTQTLKPEVFPGPRSVSANLS